MATSLAPALPDPILAFGGANATAVSEVVGRVDFVDRDELYAARVSSLLAGARIACTIHRNAQELLASPPPAVAGCVLLGLEGTGLDGIEVLHELALREDPRAVIFLAAHPDVPNVVRAMRGGATDFLVKPARELALLQAVHNGLRHSAARHIERAARDQIRQRYADLTRRERQVLSAVAAGCLNKQIAYRMQTAERTVKTHRARVMAKIGARNTAQLIRFADQLVGAGCVPEAF
jgi:FixJ family two-component response regulator